jgi:hypothetical protein
LKDQVALSGITSTIDITPYKSVAISCLPDERAEKNPAKNAGLYELRNYPDHLF